MRLSEILKNTDSSSSAPVKVRVEPQPPAPPAVPVIPKAVPQTVSQDFSAVLEQARKEIQQQLEKNFQDKLNTLENDAKRSREELLRLEEEKSFARAEALKKEKLQLLAQMEDLKQKNEELRATQQGIEELKKQMVASQEKMALSMQKKITEMDEQLRTRPAETFEEEKKKLEKQIKEELDAATHEKVSRLEQRIKELQKPLAVPALKADTPTPAPPPEPSIAPAPSGVKDAVYSAPAKTTVEAFDFLNPDVMREAKKFYEKLVHTGRGIFDQSLKGQDLDCNLFMRVLEELPRIPASYKDELVGIVVEPYPEQDYFIYHSINTMILSMMLGMDLKLVGKDLQDLGLAAFLHDISLLKLKDPLNYPKQLSEELKGEVKGHPERSAEMIAPYVNETVKTAVLHHHELSNGKGYPQGLLNDAIHLYAKIINISDAFEAMVHTRPYRSKPYEVSEAVKEMIEKERGLYDRDVVKALLSRVGLYPVKSYVELSNKQVARVLHQNAQFPLSPIVLVEFDEEGNKLTPPHTVDLTKNQLLHITGPLKTGQSYTRERLAKDKKKEDPKLHFWLVLKEIIPLGIIAAILILLVYLVVKI